MGKWLQVNRQFIFIHEVLRARLDIRDFFFQTTVREVYENIGQVLSLVRMQLAILEGSTNANIEKNIHTSGNLVGQSIRDLRTMCRSFYPDAELLKANGLIEAVENTRRILYNNDKIGIKVKGTVSDMQPEMKLVVFKMLQEILIAIKESEGECLSLIIFYTQKAVKFNIGYRGKVISLGGGITRIGTNQLLTLQERAELIDAKFKISINKVGVNQIKLISPLKGPHHE